MVHRFNIFLLSILLVFSQIIIINQAIASTVAGEGWSVSKRLVQGATTFYDGTKNIVLNGKNYAAKGTAAITPAASQVSKMIVRTGAVLAVDLAIKTLIGAVDYVMDPANNRVKYYVEPTSTSPKPTDQYIWRYTDSVNGTHDYSYSLSASSMCSIVLSLWSGKTPWKYDRVSLSSSSTTSIICYLSSSTTTYDGNSGVARVNNPAYDPNAQPNREEKYLPYDAVAAQIIGDATADKAEGKAYVSSVADTALEDEQRQIVPANEITQQLNNSQAIPTNNTATGSVTPTTGEGTGTGDPTTQPKPSDITLNFPVFCDWAPTVCSAAQTVISFPQTLTSWWTDGKKAVSDAWTYAKEWMSKEDKPSEPTEVQIDQTTPQVPNTSYFNWGAYCPFTPGAQTISLGDTSASIDYDLSSWCELASDLRPFVLAAGALMSFLIAAGIVMGRED
ncbi:virulence factor TspB C-terminal domain-related protein [Acinetobacter pittii]|uniref:virulence factor TspB C-terminal domain-related protein n=1 Tax=Acinetobacter pittii TaxID=48296 RepID=UPI001D1815E1|nr:virulence factor TspB C-terminal domain-related protein [Acinetobacter pittii]